MRILPTAVLLLALLVAGRGSVADKDLPAAKAPAFSLPSAEAATSVSPFTDAQLAYVQSLIKQKAPECPTTLSAAVAESFLEELQQRHPEKLPQLLAPDFPLAEFEPMLLRQVGLKLTGAAQAPLREEVARRRAGAVLVAGGREPRAALAEATALIAKIKDASPTQYRRLTEGKMDDDDLELVLKKTGQAATAAPEAGLVKPKVLTAVDIVSEFSRHNQAGSAVQHLQAYTVEGKLITATGEEQDLLLFKMRPDRFRLVVRAAGLTSYILAGAGGQFWQQSPGQPPKAVPADEMGARRYLTEFVDPLLVGEDFIYERREDGARDGRKFYRIAVRRPDGSGYVACIDTETFRETARENDDKSVSRYADFREVGGVTYAFREEVTGADGRKGSFTLTRVAPNPGLIEDFFEMPSRQNAGYFQIEQLLAPPAARTAATLKP